MRYFTVLYATLALGTGAVFAQDPTAPGAYRIGPRDEILIRVDNLPEVDGEQVVADDGTIVLPIVGTVPAQGLTEEELERRLRAELEQQGLRRARVEVSVISYRSRPVSLLGAVARPGNHYVPGQARLLQVLLEAGGLAESHGAEIHVRRRADNGLSDQIRIPVSELIERGDPMLNIPILAGDQINVPPVREITVHFLGEVKQPGSQTFRADEGVTLLTAIARVGGLSETASKKIRIKRKSSTGETTELEIDYRRVLDDDDPDIALADGDLIIVKESFF